MSASLNKILTRVLTGAALVVVFGLLTWGPGPLWPLGFTALVALMAAIGLHEFYGLARHRGMAPLGMEGVLIGAGIVLTGHLGNPLWVGLALAVGIVIACALHLFRGAFTVGGVAATTFGLVYVGWFGAHVALLRSVFPWGCGMVTLLLVVVILTDTGAYAVGSLIGRHKLAPGISPNKTIEGALGGLLCAVVGAGLVYVVSETSGGQAWPPGALYHYLLAGAVLAIVAQLGDLVESALKRDAGVKDSGTILPGHGGMLDRCDGFLFAAPMLFYAVFVYVHVMHLITN